MHGRHADSQTLWCVMWLDSAVTASCNLQLPAYSKPTLQGSRRDVNGTDQWGHWHSSCQIHSMSVSPSLLSSGTCFSSSSQSLWNMNRAARMSENQVVILHKFTFIFQLTCSFKATVVKLLFSYRLKALHRLIRTTIRLVNTHKHSRERIIGGGT